MSESPLQRLGARISETRAFMILAADAEIHLYRDYDDDTSEVILAGISTLSMRLGRELSEAFEVVKASTQTQASKSPKSR